MQSDLEFATAQALAWDKWWLQVFLLKKYPDMQKIVTDCMILFTGSNVESFSMMNSIISERSSSMALSTYKTLQAT